MASLEMDYQTRYDDILKPVASALETHVMDIMSTTPSVARVDRISVRAKTPKSFMAKTRKVDEKGQLYYSDPLTQIQDQIGARIIMFFLDDVKDACSRVMRYFTIAEQQAKEPESEWEFGYFGRHFILALPIDAIPATIGKEMAPRVFELQVRTLFQHAWSEANHDIVYKSSTPLSTLQKRQCAYTAAQSWGADHAFQELYDELRPDTVRIPS